MIMGKVQVVLPQLEGTPGHDQLATIKTTVKEAAKVLRYCAVMKRFPNRRRKSGRPSRPSGLISAEIYRGNYRLPTTAGR